MTKNREFLNHGLHNEQVCEYLQLRPEFSDWILTTAFYASLQFVSYFVFPLEKPSIDGKKTKIETLDELYRYDGRPNRSKHKLLADLVAQKLPAVAEDYDRLLDYSMNVGYRRYTFNDYPLLYREYFLYDVPKAGKACCFQSVSFN